MWLSTQRSFVQLLLLITNVLIRIFIRSYKREEEKKKGHIEIEKLQLPIYLRDFFKKNKNRINRKSAQNNPEMNNGSEILKKKKSFLCSVYI